MGNAKGPSAALPQPDAVLRQHPAERDRGPALADEGFSRRHREPSPGRDGARPRLPVRCRGAAPVSASIGFGASGRLSAGPANTVPGRWYRRGRRFPGFRIFIGQGLQALLFFYPQIDRKGRKDPPDPAPLRPGRRSMAGGANRPLWRLPRRLRMRKIAGRSLAGAGQTACKPAVIRRS